MIKDNGIDEFCGLNSIIKLSSSDLAKNGVAIMSRQLERTTSRMVFIVPFHFIINLPHTTLSQTNSCDILRIHGQYCGMPISENHCVKGCNIGIYTMYG